MSNVEDLKARIKELEEEVQSKEVEIIQKLDRIEQLEDEIMRFESLVPDEDGKVNSSDSKLAIQMDAKDKQIRELKDKLGYLRKEKIQLQKELEKITKEKNEMSTAKVDNKKGSTPLDSLVNELQTKINRQRLLITKLKQQTMGADAAELNEKLRKKDKEVDILKTELNGVKSKLDEFRDSARSSSADTIRQALTEELQEKLNKAKRQIGELKKQLGKAGKKPKKSKKDKTETAIDDLQDKIDELQEQLNSKNAEINKLKTSMDKLKESASSAPEKPAAAPSGPLSGLAEELQSKLSKARIQIKEYKSKLDELQAGNTGTSEASMEAQKKLQEEIDKHKELVSNLQEQILKQSEEFGSVKHEATEFKIKCEDLESQVSIKDEKIADLKKQLLDISSQAQTNEISKETPEALSLRLRELKSMVNDMEKQNIQQRFELNKLKNSLF